MAETVSQVEPFPEPPLLEVLDARGEPVDTCILDLAEKDTGPPWLFSVGRQASCDVPIDHPSVGAHHLDVAFTMLGGVLCVKLVPVDHANPTKIKSMVLPPGRRFTVRSQQVFKVGDVNCRIVLPMQPSSPTSALSAGHPFSAEVASTSMPPTSAVQIEAASGNTQGQGYSEQDNSGGGATELDVAAAAAAAAAQLTGGGSSCEDDEDLDDLEEEEEEEQFAMGGTQVVEMGCTQLDAAALAMQNAEDDAQVDGAAAGSDDEDGVSSVAEATRAAAWLGEDDGALTEEEPDLSQLKVAAGPAAGVSSADAEHVFEATQPDPAAVAMALDTAPCAPAPSPECAPAAPPAGAVPAPLPHALAAATDENATQRSQLAEPRDMQGGVATEAAAAAAEAAVAEAVVDAAVATQVADGAAAALAVAVAAAAAMADADSVEEAPQGQVDSMVSPGELDELPCSSEQLMGSEQLLESEQLPNRAPACGGALRHVSRQCATAVWNGESGESAVSSPPAPASTDCWSQQTDAELAALGMPQLGEGCMRHTEPAVANAAEGAETSGAAGMVAAASAGTVANAVGAGDGLGCDEKLSQGMSQGSVFGAATGPQPQASSVAAAAPAPAAAAANAAAAVTYMHSPSGLEGSPANAVWHPASLFGGYESASQKPEAEVAGTEVARAAELAEAASECAVGESAAPAPPAASQESAAYPNGLGDENAGGFEDDDIEDVDDGAAPYVASQGPAFSQRNPHFYGDPEFVHRGDFYARGGVQDDEEGEVSEEERRAAEDYHASTPGSMGGSMPPPPQQKPREPRASEAAGRIPETPGQGVGQSPEAPQFDLFHEASPDDDEVAAAAERDAMALQAQLAAAETAAEAAAEARAASVAMAGCTQMVETHEEACPEDAAEAVVVVGEEVDGAMAAVQQQRAPESSDEGGPPLAPPPFYVSGSAMPSDAVAGMRSSGMYRTRRGEVRHVEAAAAPAVSPTAAAAATAFATTGPSPRRRGPSPAIDEEEEELPPTTAMGPPGPPNPEGIPALPPPLGKEAIVALKVDELREALLARGLPSEGRKKELVKRLCDACESHVRAQAQAAQAQVAQAHATAAEAAAVAAAAEEYAAAAQALLSAQEKAAAAEAEERKAAELERKAAEKKAAAEVRASPKYAEKTVAEKAMAEKAAAEKAAAEKAAAQKAAAEKAAAQKAAAKEAAAVKAVAEKAKAEKAKADKARAAKAPAKANSKGAATSTAGATSAAVEQPGTAMRSSKRALDESDGPPPGKRPRKVLNSGDKISINLCGSDDESDAENEGTTAELAAVRRSSRIESSACKPGAAVLLHFPRKDAKERITLTYADVRRL